MNNKLNKSCIIVVSVVIASTLGYGDALAESEINLVAEKTVFEPSARIFLTGTVDPEDAFYEPVSIIVYDVNGNEIIHVKSDVDYKHFAALITGPLGSFEKGMYVIEASHVSAINTAKVVISIDDLTYDLSLLSNLMPL